MSALLALLAPAAAITAQDFECAALRPSASQQPAYQRVPGEARCEGFFEQSVSQPFVELVSLTRGVPQLESPAVATLRAASAGPGTRLVIQPLRAAPLYRVDAPLASGQTLTWDPRPMLAATGLQSRDLGFLAWGAPMAGALPSAAAVSLAASDAASQAGFAMLRASVALSAIAWRTYPVGGAAAPGAWRSHAAPPPYAWQPVAIAIELLADDAQGAALRIDVRAHDARGEPLPLLSFAVLGAAP